MKITVLANRDLHSNIALNLLQPLWEQHELTVLMSDGVGTPSGDYEVPADLSHLRFLEQQLFNEVISPLARQQLAGGRFLTFDEIASNGDEVSTLASSINEGAGLDTLLASEPDLVLSIRFGQILREKAIAVPSLGVLNLHSGLLPRYKGILTTLHSLIEGQDEVGCTLHQINSAEIDAGPIVGTASIAVDRSKSLFWHVLQLYPIGCELIIDAVGTLASGAALTYQQQNNEGQRYFSLPAAEDFRKLKEQGFRVWDDEDLLPVYRRYLVDADVLDMAGGEG